jgi:hypothetical protein
MIANCYIRKLKKHKRKITIDANVGRTWDFPMQ